MDTKKCFKCGVEKNINEFYRHPQMGDGHLNKCKECTKKDVKMKYAENIEMVDYVEKERARGREKYSRLNYKDRFYNKKPVGKDTSKHLKSLGLLPKEHEAHHWNYNFAYDVFILSRKAHKLVHKDLTYDESTKMFFQTSTGIILDTKEKHFEYIKKIFHENNVNYEIDVYAKEL